jgi:hypothetical protein
MKTPTWSESSDHQSAEPVLPSVAVGGKATTTVRCRLCREVILLETNFRPTTAACPHCGLKFAFDPQKEQEPLPVRGLRLHYSATSVAEHGPATQPDTHVRAANQLPQAQATPAQAETNHLESKANFARARSKRRSGVGVLARPLAAIAAMFRAPWPACPRWAADFGDSLCQRRRFQGVLSWLILLAASGSANEDKTENETECLTTDLDKIGSGSPPATCQGAPWYSSSSLARRSRR